MNVAGDSVLGSKLDGVLYYQCQATDANAAGGGGSDLTATELGIGLAQQIDVIQCALQDFGFIRYQVLNQRKKNNLNQNKLRQSELDPMFFAGVKQTAHHIKINWSTRS